MGLAVTTTTRKAGPAAARSDGCQALVSGSITRWSASLMTGSGALNRVVAELKPVRGSKAAPVPTLDADRHVDFARHYGGAVAHVARLVLDQE
jgi:hypothetical protein